MILEITTLLTSTDYNLKIVHQARNAVRAFAVCYLVMAPALQTLIFVNMLDYCYFLVVPQGSRDESVSHINSPSLRELSLISPSLSEESSASSPAEPTPLSDVALL